MGILTGKFKRFRSLSFRLFGLV